MFFSMNDLVFEVIFFVGISERSVFLGLSVFCFFSIAVKPFPVYFLECIVPALKKTPPKATTKMHKTTQTPQLSEIQATYLVHYL